MTAAPSSRPRRLRATLRESASVTPLELFFDLVFVLALTQCTALMAEEPTWEGLAKGLLVLGVLWWAWVGYAWLTSVVDPEEGVVRLAMFAAMAGLLVVALCVPEAFDRSALLFAVAYGVVRYAQVVLLAMAGRDDAALQGVLWAAALALDMAGPFLFGSEGWRLMPSPFAERHGLIVIIALGESIVAIGVGSEVGVDAAVV